MIMAVSSSAMASVSSYFGREERSLIAAKCRRTEGVRRSRSTHVAMSRSWRWRHNRTRSSTVVRSADGGVKVQAPNEPVQGAAEQWPPPSQRRLNCQRPTGSSGAHTGVLREDDDGRCLSVDLAALGGPREDESLWC
jgi:hypothetical protein